MISLSLERICEGAMAVSALRVATYAAKRPTLLEKENLPALKRVATDLVAQCLLRIADMVQDTNADTIDPDSEDTVTVELAIRTNTEGCAQRAIEAAVTAALLSTAYGNTDAAVASADYREMMTNMAVVSALRLRVYPRTIRPSA